MTAVGGPARDGGWRGADVSLKELLSHLGKMTELALEMVRGGTKALLDSDRDSARSVLSKDPELDRFDIDIEAETMRLIATLQPEGRDLRTLGAMLKIANCVDRVGRLGYDLAEYVSEAPDVPERAHQDLLRSMDEKARAMVAQSVHAFVTGDAAEAKRVFAMDDEVDELHQNVQRQVIALLQKGGLSTDRLAFELLSARHLERVGDNACKIAEKAVYAITGERRTEYFPALAHAPRPTDSGS